MVVPARNEARNLALVLPTIDPAHEVVVVDGGSDRTAETVAAVRPSARVVRQTRPGKGNALVCGFAEATGHVLVMLDADGSADPAEIPRFVDALLAGADLAKGSRRLPGGGSTDLTRLRGLGNRALTAGANLLLGSHHSDLCYGFNAFWADVLPRLALPSPYPAGHEMRWGDGFEIEAVLYCRAAAAGLRVAEVPSFERGRYHGHSNLHAARDGLRVAATLLRERRGRRPAPALSPAPLGFAG
ncbi:glycosyl transferase [Pseudonocardia sp. CNS-139]|nr:glycosyl transferase [Pseudonocardia sp. CNS-139]